MEKLKGFLFIFSLAITGVMGALGVLIVSGMNDHLGKADIALVLGSKVNSDGRPGPRLQARLDKAVELYRAGYFPTIIVSGGTGKEGYDEAKVMAEELISNGIPAESIIMDNAGVNTFASANNTSKILHQANKKSVFVISQYFHLPRARLALKRFGVSTIYSAHATFFEIRDIYSLLREAGGYVFYFFRDYSSDK